MDCAQTVKESLSLEYPWRGWWAVVSTEEKARTLDDLILENPELARLRYLSLDRLRKILCRQKGECTGCGNRVNPGFRWCSHACRELHYVRCLPAFALRFVRKRDKGICQICGRDTVVSRKQAQAEGLMRYPWPEAYLDKAARMAKRAEFGYGRGCFSEVDHIIPVSKGGGLCRPENLRLLCGVCHAAATKELFYKPQVVESDGE